MRKAAIKKRLTFKLDNDTIIVFRYGTTSNDKICSDPKRKILQTYSFSRGQFELAKSRLNDQLQFNTDTFFSQDREVCKDCPFSANMNGGKAGKCYTHKGVQYFGFLSTLKSIVKEFDSNFDSIPDLGTEAPVELLRMCETYVRFGSYGEPSLIPLSIVSEMIAVCVTSGNLYTGYSHQMHITPEFNKYFMNSAHDMNSGMRSFIVTDKQIKDKSIITCPASAEGGYKSSCHVCGLCSGTAGKGSKSVAIVDHA